MNVFGRLGYALFVVNRALLEFEDLLQALVALTQWHSSRWPLR